MYLYILIAIIFVIYFFGTDLRHRWFAYMMKLFQSNPDPQYEELKKDLFKPLSSMVSHDTELRRKKAIKILEIGVGTGVNFEYYPDGTQLVVIDPNPHFAKYYNDNRNKFKNIKSEEIIVCTGENMDQVESNSVDAIVITLVMCSVTEVKSLLKQIKRVLVPGGKFYFFEHIEEFDESNHYMRRFIQNLLTVTRVWPVLFDGCMLNRDCIQEMEAAGFTDIEYKRVHAPIKSFVFSIIAPHLIGVATK